MLKTPKTSRNSTANLYTECAETNHKKQRRTKHEIHSIIMQTQTNSLYTKSKTEGNTAKTSMYRMCLVTTSLQCTQINIRALTCDITITISIW